jgi:hypothetical protein
MEDSDSMDAMDASKNMDVWENRVDQQQHEGQ